MIFSYNIFSVAYLGAKLTMLQALATLAMLTRLLEELQKKYYIEKSSEFNFLKDRKGWKRHNVRDLFLHLHIPRTFRDASS